MNRAVAILAAVTCATASLGCDRDAVCSGVTGSPSLFTLGDTASEEYSVGTATPCKDSDGTVFKVIGTRTQQAGSSMDGGCEQTSDTSTNTQTASDIYLTVVPSRLKEAGVTVIRSGNGLACMGEDGPISGTFVQIDDWLYTDSAVKIIGQTLKEYDDGCDYFYLLVATNPCPG